MVGPVRNVGTNSRVDYPMNPLRIRLDSLEKLLTLYDFKICDLELYGIRDTCKVNWESYVRHRQWRYILAQRRKG